MLPNYFDAKHVPKALIGQDSSDLVSSLPQVPGHTEAMIMDPPKLTSF